MLSPTIGVQVSEFPSIAATMDGKNYYFQRVQGGTVFVAHPLFNNFSQEISNIGVLEVSVNNLNPIQEFISTHANRNLIREGLNNYVALEFQSQNIYGGYTADIHPLGGYRFNLRLEDATRFLGSKYEYIQIRSDLRNYISIPFLPNNVLAFRGNFEFSTGNITPLFLGGPPINVNIGIQNFVPLRGFNIAELLGNRLVLGSLEYRFPIFTRMNFTFSGIYIDGIYAALFADIGDSWFEEERRFQLNTGLGGEIRIRVGVGNRSTIGTYIGLARKIVQENKFLDFDKVNNQFYFGFANAF
jgi:outer membrane protein assembly factor BamA